MRGWTAQTKQDAANNPEAWLKRTLATTELRHIKFNYFKKGILSINVDSSGWLYNLSLQKEDLLARLKKNCNTIKEIRFRIGEVK